MRDLKIRFTGLYLPGEGIPHDLKALGYGGIWILLPFELHGNIAAVIHFTEDLGHPVVIDVKGVPFAPAIVGFCLDEISLRGKHFQLFILTVEEVACVGSYLEPW
jgi:hypothetical protein